MKSLAEARLFYFSLIFISKYSYMTDFNRTPEAQEVFKTELLKRRKYLRQNANQKVLSNSIFN